MSTQSFLGDARRKVGTALGVALIASVCLLVPGLSSAPVGAQSIPACIDFEDLTVGDTLAGTTASGPGMIEVDEDSVEVINPAFVGGPDIVLNFNGIDFAGGAPAQATFTLPPWAHGWSFDYDWSGAGTALGVNGTIEYNGAGFDDFDGDSINGGIVSASDTGTRGIVSIRGVQIDTLTIGGNDPNNEIDDICPLPKPLVTTPVTPPNVATTIPTPGSAFPCGDAQIVSPTSIPLLAWSNQGGSVADYWVYIGSTLGEKDYFDSGNVGGANATFVSGLPTDGSTVYVRLYYRRGIQGVAWEWIDTTYSACTQGA